MRDYRNLAVRKRAHALVLAVLLELDLDTRRAPPGLVGQLRRSAMAIPTNIAEGAGHESRREFARYLAIAAASAVELEYLLTLARDLGLSEATQHSPLEAETIAVRRMCRGLRTFVLTEQSHT